MSLARDIMNEDLEDLIAFWNRRFPGGPELGYSRAAKVLEKAKRAWLDPRWILEQVKTTAEDPITYLMGLINLSTLRPSKDADERLYTFKRWQDRPRHTKPVTIGDVLRTAQEGQGGTIPERDHYRPTKPRRGHKGPDMGQENLL